jgi:SRSO17 transposase
VKFAHDYRPYFTVARRNVADQARKYLNGLLAKAPRKNLERMEEFVEDFDYQSQQQFLSDSPWSHRDVMDRVALDVSEVLGGPECGLILDESGFSKKGKMSAGVARQYNGRLGKLDNCQVGVFASLTDGKSNSIVDASLFLPEEWTDDPSRCRKAKVPEEEMIARTKVELAYEMVTRQRRLGVQFSWVGFDALYGSSGWFLNALDAAGEIFAADVRGNRVVYPEGIEGKGIAVEAFFKNQTQNWEVVAVREGEKGKLRVKACARRVWVEVEKEDRCWWAVCVTELDGTEPRWFLSNASEITPAATLVRRHALRFWIERGFQDGKTSLGMGDYQVRGWVAWHHHMAMVILAQLFLLKERRLHLAKVELLSCNDVVELLNAFLPRRDTTPEEVVANMRRRHAKRKQARKNMRKRSRKAARRSKTTDLTK